MDGERRARADVLTGRSLKDTQELLPNTVRQGAFLT